MQCIAFNRQHNTERRKWIHMFQEVTTLFFVVDMSSYARSTCDDANEMMEQICLFDQIVNSPWFFSFSDHRNVQQV